MTGSEILSYIETRVGREVSPDHVLIAINEALNEIGDMGLLYDTTEAVVTNTKEWFALPEDFTMVKTVMLQGRWYLDWQYVNGKIKFDDVGVFTIIARKMAPTMNNIAENLPLHRLYHNGIQFYALGWVYENDNPNDMSAERAYQKFVNSVSGAAKTLIGTKPPMSWTVIRHA